MGEPDPEQVLATYPWRFDPDTLREVLDDADTALLRGVRAGLTTRLAAAGDDPTHARLLSLRAVVARSLGELDDARADGLRALRYAEATGSARLIAIVRVRLAHVYQWRGEFEPADRHFALALAAEVPDPLRGSFHQHAGKCAYEQGRYIEACNHFERALHLRRDAGPDLIASTHLALDGVFRRVAEHGWGPYPRPLEEILGTRAAPAPTYDDRRGHWGYATADGFTIAPQYADAQPFAEGVAWVLRPGDRTWTLIDAAGTVLIGPAAGLDDVRPFRHGLAAVAVDGRWGAIDATGRVVVPFGYDGFATALHDGRYVDGFSAGGFAVVRRAGRHGVVDRAGRVVVPPVHAVVVVHPVAFLFTEGPRWGALDRSGRPLVPPVHATRSAVADEVDRRLVDARPAL